MFISDAHTINNRLRLVVHEEFIQSFCIVILPSTPLVIGLFDFKYLINTLLSKESEIIKQRMNFERCANITKMNVIIPKFNLLIYVV